MLKRFRSSLQDYKELLATAEAQKVDVGQAMTSGKYVYDYNFSKARYLGDNMRKAVGDLRRIITDLYKQSSNPELGEQYSRIMVQVRLLEEKYYDPVRSGGIVLTIEKLLGPLERDEFIRHEIEELEEEMKKKSVSEESSSDSSQAEEQSSFSGSEVLSFGSDEMPTTSSSDRSEILHPIKGSSQKTVNNKETGGLPEIDLPFLPDEIKTHMIADIHELEKCYNLGCYRSAVILCGRLLEIALHRKYFEVTGNDALEKNPGIGLGKLVAKLSEENMSFDPGLMNQVHLINNMRISSVHVKQDLFRPNQNQTQAAILYTLDILHKMFSK